MQSKTMTEEVTFDTPTRISAESHKISTSLNLEGCGSFQQDLAEPEGWCRMMSTNPK